MDKTQNRILKDIIDKFKLPIKIKFIQFRNLREFKYFTIERINPTHRIILFGKLKNNKCKNHVPKGFIKVGEIIIPCITLFFNLQLIVDYINIICLFFNLFFVFNILFYYSINLNFLKVLYVNWNRRFFWRWENSLFS